MPGIFSRVCKKLRFTSDAPVIPQIYVLKSAPNGIVDFPVADPLSGHSTVRDGQMITYANNMIAASCASLGDTDTDTDTSDDGDDVNFSRDGSVRVEDVVADVNVDVTKWTKMWKLLSTVKGVFKGDHQKGSLRSGEDGVGRTVVTRDAGAYEEVLVDEEAEAHLDEDGPEVIRPSMGSRSGSEASRSDAQSIVSASAQSIEEDIQAEAHLDEDGPEVIRPSMRSRSGSEASRSDAQSIVSASAQSIEEDIQVEAHSEEHRPEVIRPSMRSRSGSEASRSDAESIISESTQSTDEDNESSVYTQYGSNCSDSSMELDKRLMAPQSLEDDVASAVDGYSAGTCENSYTVSRSENFSSEATQVDEVRELCMQNSFDELHPEAGHDAQTTRAPVATAAVPTNLTANNTPTLFSGHHQYQSLQNLPTTNLVTHNTAGLPFGQQNQSLHNHLAATNTYTTNQASFIAFTDDINFDAADAPAFTDARRFFQSVFAQEAQSTAELFSSPFPSKKRGIFGIIDAQNAAAKNLQENGQLNKPNNMQPDYRVWNRRGEEAEKENEDWVMVDAHDVPQDDTAVKRKREAEEEFNEDWVMVEQPDHRDKRVRTEKDIDAETCAWMGMNMGMGGMQMAC